MRVLVTGATGLLGNNIVRALVDQQQNVNVLVRASSPQRALEGLPVQQHVGDVCDAQSVQQAMQGADAVIHSAGYVKIGWKDEDQHQRINVDGTENVAQAARQAGIRMVHVSTINTLGLGNESQLADERTWLPGIVECPYVVTKKKGEQMVEQLVSEGLDACIVHPAFMLGPWDWKPSSGEMVVQVARRFTPFAPRGGMSVCDVREVALATVRAVEKGAAGEHFVLAGENMSYFRLWKIIAQVTGSRGPLCPAGPLMRVGAGAFGDLWAKFSSQEPDVNSAAVGLSSQTHFFSSAKAQAHLGYEIRPTADVVTAAWEWFRAHGYA